MLANFQLGDKQEKMRFFQEIFLVAYTAMAVLLGVHFIVLSKIEINFAN